MLLWIHMLDIHQIKIQIRKHLFNNIKTGAAHAFHRRIDANLLRCLQKRGCKLRLQQTLAAGQRDSATGTLIIRHIPDYGFHDLSYRHISADRLRFSVYHHRLYVILL